MKLRTLDHLPWSALICCSIMLTLLLSACDMPGSSTNANPTPKPTTPPAPELTSYTGDGYTIGYPEGWTQKQDNHQVSGQKVPTTTFTDSLGVHTFTVGVLPNPNGFVPAKTALDGTLQIFKANVKNSQQVSTEPQTTIGGQSWDQTAASGDITQQGTTANAKAISLACNYPANSASTKLYFILYAGPEVTFDSTNSASFQPMLQSFKFS